VKPVATIEQSGLVAQSAWRAPGSIRQIRDLPVGAGNPFSSLT
jgi:hypothetical protein